MATYFFADRPDQSASLSSSNTSDTGNHVVVIDTTVEGYETLTQGVDPSATLLLVDGNDGFSGLAEALADFDEIDTLEIVSHGASGELHFGGETLKTSTFNEHSDAIEAIRSAMAEDGDILLYGCDIGADGSVFVEAFAEATGADVAASNDLTGNGDLGGDWDLEVVYGDVESVEALSAQSMQAFDNLLVSTGTEDFGSSISVLRTDSNTAVSDVGGSGLSATYSGNTDAVDIIIAAPSDAYTTSVGNPGYGEAANGDKSLMFGHFVGNGTTLAGSAEVINYVSLESDNGTETFDLDGFQLYYRGTSALNFTIGAYDSGGSQIGSNVTINSGDFASNNDSGFTAGFIDVTDAMLGSDFDNVVEFRITPSDANAIAVIGIDDIQVATVSSNSAPDLGGTPADDTATEDVATAIDLSAYNISDGDGDDPITITLAVDRGTIASIDGNGTFDSVTVSNSGTTSMTLSGSAANLNTYLNDTSHITFTTASNDTTSATLTVTPNDGTEDGTADTVTITVTPVNDDPTGSGVPSDLTFTEDTQSNVNLTSVDLSDVDSASVTLTITASEGIFGTPADGAGVGGSVTESRVSDTVVTLAGAPDDIDTFLDTASNITWTPATNDNGNDASTFTLTINDGDGSGDVSLGTINADVTPVNDDPTITGLVSDITVTEDTASDLNLSAADFSDVDSTGTVFVTLTASEGTLTASTDGTVTVGGSGTSAITLSGTFDQIETYLDTTTRVSYTSALNDSGEDAATLTITGNDDDGSGDVTLGTVNLDITNVNDDPAVSGLVTDLTFTEDTSGNVNLSAADFDDVDSASITVTITASEGIFGTPADGAGVGGSVTESRVSDTEITLVGAADDIDTYLDTASNITWTPVSNDSGEDTSTFTITANDGDGSGDVSLGTVNADVTAVNDDPTVSGLPTDISFTEDTSGNVTLSSADFGDVDSASITVTITASEGTFGTPANGAGVGSGVTETLVNSTTITLAGAADDIDTYLDTASNITWTPASDDSGEDTSTFTITANDGDGSGDVSLGTVNADVTNVNDAPVLDNSGSPTLTSVDEDAGDDDGSGADGDDDATNNANNGGTTVASMVTDGSITDADGSATESIAVITVDNTNGLWQYSTDSGSNWNNFSGTTGSSQDISANAVVLESTDLIRFVPGENYQSTATITYRAWDGSDDPALSGGDTIDGSSGGGSSSLSTATETATITVSGVNDVPSFSGLDDTPTFTEDGSAVTLDDDVTVADQELDSLNSSNGDFSGAVLTIARNGGADSDDALAVASGGNLTVAGGPNGGGTITAGGNVIATITDAGDDDELTITFADNGTTPTGALVDEALQAVTYSNSSNDPDSSVQLDWSFSDGNSGDAQGTGDNPGTASGSITVSVTGVNDAPTLTATGGNPTFIEDGSASDLFNTVTADTVEAGQTFSAMTMTITNVSDTGNEVLNADGTAITLDNGESGTTTTNSLSYSVSVSGSTATLSFTGGTLSEAQLQTLVDGMTYQNNSDTPTTSGNRVVTITGLTDSGGTANSGVESSAPNLTSTVTITAVNDAPVITGVDGESSDVVAGTGAADVTLFDDATVTNSDSSDYNGGFLTISQNTGTTNGSWSVDGTNVTSGGDATVSAGETIAVGGNGIGTVDVTDDGQGGNDFTINFGVNATNARVETLLQNLGFSGPSGIDARTFTLTLNDADGFANSGDQDTTAGFTINVTPNPPVFGNLSGDSFTFTEGDSATDIDVGGNATVTDADSTDFDGGDFTVSITANQAAEDRLVIDTSGSVSLSGGQTAGSTVSVSSTAIGTIDSGSTGGESEDLVISLNSSATPALVQTLVQAIQYNNAGGDNPTDGDRTISFTLTDGTGGTSAAATVTVNVDPVNDDPSASGLPTDISFTEDTSGSVDLSALDLTDDDSGSITVTITASEGTFATPGDGAGVGGGVTETLVNSTTVTLAGAADDIDTYLDTASNITWTSATNDNGGDTSTFTITANDGDGSGDVSLGTVNADVTAVNDDPTLTGQPTDISFTEDTSGNVTLSSADFGDVDSASITVTITASEGTFGTPADGASVGGGVTETLVNSTTITLAGAPDDIDTYLDTASNITWTSATNDTGEDTSTFTITANDGDGSGDVSLATVNADVSNVNDNPTVSALPADVTVTEDTASNVDLSASNFSDVDSASITVTLTASEGTFASPADGAGVGGGVTETLVNSTTITLAGAPDDIDTYLDTASNIQYTSSLNDEGDNAATISVSANDGDGSGDVSLGSVNLDITPVNDAPTSSGGSESVRTDQTLTFASGDFNFSDVDSGDTLSSIQIASLPTTGSLALSSVAVTVNQVIAVADIGNLVYTPSGTGADSFTYLVNDGTVNADSAATMSISVQQPQNQPPSAPSLSGRTVSENAAGATIGRVSASDPEGNLISFSVNDSRFTIDGNTLKLKSGVSLDFEETPSINLTITARDAGGSNSSSFTISVTDVDEDNGSTISGDDEDNNFIGGNGGDIISTQGGKDTIDGGAGDDNIDGGDDDDSLQGGDGDDTMQGGTGEDSLEGGLGNDLIDAGDGNDLVFAGLGDLGNDIVRGGGGLDSLGGGFGNDLLQGEDNDDLLWGRFGADTVDGGSGNDMLYNGEGNDTVIGGTGNDTLWAGNDDDLLGGGDGEDVFMFGAVSGNDSITDFNISEDQINLRFSGSGYSSVSQVIANSSVSTQNGETGVLIDIGNDQSIFIRGLSLADLNNVDFVL